MASKQSLHVMDICLSDPMSAWQSNCLKQWMMASSINHPRRMHPICNGNKQWRTPSLRHQQLVSRHSLIHSFSRSVVELLPIRIHPSQLQLQFLHLLLLHPLYLWLLRLRPLLLLLLRHLMLSSHAVMGIVAVIQAFNCSSFIYPRISQVMIFFPSSPSMVPF